MSGLYEMPGDAVANRLLGLMADVVALTNDKSAQKRLADLAKATKAADERIVQANAANKASDEKLAEHDERMKTERAEHEDALLVARQKLEVERTAFERTRTGLLDEASKLRDEAQHDQAAASAKLKQLNDKLSLIQSVA